jgi:hypothetical protein
MHLVAHETCRIKSLFGACGAEAVARCQYCNRSFCARHGVVLDDGQEVCSRKECVAKREDLERHLLYKDAVRRLNEANACGVPGCQGEIEAQCVRCKGLFCASHVRRREEQVLENQVRVSRMATTCRHCSARRAIWVRQ